MKRTIDMKVLVPGAALVCALAVLAAAVHWSLSRRNSNRARDPDLEESGVTEPGAAEPARLAQTAECLYAAPGDDVHRRTLLSQAVKGILALSEPPREDPGELMRVVCQHGVHSIDCDDCRPRIGVLRLPPGLDECFRRCATINPRTRPEKLRLEGNLEYDVSRLAVAHTPVAGLITETRTGVGLKISRGDVVAVIHSRALAFARTAYLASGRRLEIAQGSREEFAQLTRRLMLVPGSREDTPPTGGSEAGASVEECLAWLKSREFRLLPSERGEKIRKTLRAELGKVGKLLRDAQLEFDAAKERLNSFDLEPAELGDPSQWLADSSLFGLNILAPLTGTVTSLPAHPRGRVEKYAALATIADLTRLHLYAMVRSEDRDRLRMVRRERGHLRAHVRVPSQGSVLMEGEVKETERLHGIAAAPGSLRIEIRNDSEVLRPGMRAVAWIELTGGDRVATVPWNAVWGRQGDRFLLLLWKDGLWLRRSVVLNQCRGKLVDVRGSIPEGATLGICRLHGR